MINVGSNVLKKHESGYVEQFHVCSCRVRNGEVYYILRNVAGKKFEVSDTHMFVEIGAAR